MRYTLARAAELAEASYEGKSAEVIGWQWSDTLDQNEVMAHLLTDDTVLITGSNSLMDYVQYNARIQRIGAPRLKLSNVNVPATWHQGFLAYTKGVQDWLMEKNVKPTFIIGHSLGAAAAQILSAGLDVHAVAFAAPRTCRTANAKALAPKCLCVNRTDDLVCTLPGRFDHLGNVRAYRPSDKTPGMDHHMRHYRKAVDDGVARKLLPTHWPERL